MAVTVFQAYWSIVYRQVQKVSLGSHWQLVRSFSVVSATGMTSVLRADGSGLSLHFSCRPGMSSGAKKEGPRRPLNVEKLN